MKLLEVGAPPPKMLTMRTAPTKRAGVKLGAVVVPTDFSRASIQALDYAAWLLERFEGELHLVHVDEPDYSYAVPSLLAMGPVVSPGEIERIRRGRLGRLAQKHAPPNREVFTHVLSGRAYLDVCQFAGQIDAGMIVMSTRGQTGLKRVLLGSTAERIVRHAPCPVLVVRQPHRKDKTTSPRLKKILVPTDFSECSRHGLDYAIRLARVTGARLVLFHAWKLLPYIPGDRFAAYETVPSPDVIERAVRAEMQQFVRKTDFAGVAFETRLECGPPAHQICDYAEDRAVDLIVTSTHGTTGLLHLLIGSVAEHIVRYAGCPTLVVPQREKQTARKGK